MSARIVRPVLILLLALLCGSVSAVDTKRFEILKGIHYFQVGNGAVYLQTNNMYRFTTQVYADVVGDVLGSSIYTPVHPRIDLLPDNDGDPLAFKDKFDTQVKFENNFPNGTYSLGIRGAHDGDRTMTFSLTGDVYPSTPVVNNYEGLQDLVYNLYNEISWQPFAGGTENDFIQFQIENPAGDNVWETPDFGENGALDGRATRTIIPAGTLAPGVVYTGTIRFVKVLYGSSLDYPGAIGTVGYYKRTQFTIRPKSISGVNPVVDRLQIWRRHKFEESADDSVTNQVVPWEFESKLDAISSNQITGVRLYLPSGYTNDFVADETFSEFETASLPLTNQTAFASIYKDGAYTFDISKTDATVQRAVVNLPAGAFPPTPKILNVASMTNHPAGDPITVSWQPWVGAGELDFIRVELSNEDGKVWDTSNFSSPKHLRPTETSVTIPGTNFVAGHDYTLQVHFYHVNVSDTAVIPGALVFGGFDTRTKFEFSTQLPDVPSFRVAEGQYLWQRGTNRYEADPLGQFRFEARATMATATSLRGAQVRTPKNETFPLARTGTNLFFQFVANEGTSGSLADRFPAGIYTMTFDTQFDGARTASIALTNTALPPIPYVLSLNTMETRPNTADFRINWLPWPGADTNTDKIQFTLVDLANRPVIDTSDSDIHPLTALSTNITILGNNQSTRELAPNRSYIARLRFERRAKAESGTYPGARGTAAVFSEVAFYLSTFSPTATYRSAASFDRTNRLVQIKVGTFPQIGRTYGVYESADFRTWSFIGTGMVTTNNVILFTTPPAGSGPFYKTVLLP